MNYNLKFLRQSLLLGIVFFIFGCAPIVTPKSMTYEKPKIEKDIPVGISDQPKEEAKMLLTDYSFLKDTVIPLFSAFLGALIGGLFTLKGVKQAYEFDKLKEEKRERTLIRSFLQMIRAEIKTVWDQYYSTIGSRLDELPANTLFPLIFPIESEYFTVYKNNTSTLGNLPDDNLRVMIVATYTLASGLLDSYKMNNKALKEYESFLIGESLQDDSLKPIVAQKKDGLTQYAAALKNRHGDLKKSVSKLLEELDKVLARA